MSEPAAVSAPGGADAGIPEPSFQVLDAQARRHAAAPTLDFTGHVSESSGREVYTIALSAQIMFEPAKRSYDDATRERLVELFGEPERWASTTNNFLWKEIDLLVPAFTGATSFRMALECSYDLEVAAAKFVYSLPDGRVPLLFNFTGTIFHRGEGGRMQIVQVPWDCSARYELPVDTWREMMENHYPHGGWVRLDRSTLDTLAARKAEQGLPTFDATVADLLEGKRS